MSMPRRTLGRGGLRVSALGLGCMGLSEFYGPTDEAQSLRALAQAVDAGVDFLDTADTYGPHDNEALIGRFLRSCTQTVFVASKCGIVRAADPAVRGVDNRPGHIRASCEGSLRRLGVETIDLYYLHRIDPAVPIEESVGALGMLVADGKVRHIGLSEPAPDTLRRAHAVHPITAVQSEYSLATRDVEQGVLPTCRALGVGFVAYSPLGRGLLTAAPPDPAGLAEDDFRRRIPRFDGDAGRHNRRLAGKLAELSAGLALTPAQLALAWLLNQGEDIVPIPGSKRAERVAENVAVAGLRLASETLRALDALFAPGSVQGERNSPHGMALLGR